MATPTPSPSTGSRDGWSVEVFTEREVSPTYDESCRIGNGEPADGLAQGAQAVESKPKETTGFELRQDLGPALSRQCEVEGVCLLESSVIVGLLFERLQRAAKARTSLYVGRHTRLCALPTPAAGCHDKNGVAMTSDSVASM